MTGSVVINFDGNSPVGVMKETNRGDSKVFGDMIVLKDDKVPIYVMLLKGENVNLFIYSWNSEDNKMVLNTPIHTREFDDLEMVDIDSLCFIGCGTTSRFICLAKTNDVYQINTETNLADATNCFMASSVRTREGETFLAMAVNEETSIGQVQVYKYSKVDQQFNQVQSVNCYMCSFANLGVYQDELFISLVSTPFGYLYLGKWNAVDKRFQSHQSLNYERPSEAIFYNHDGYLYLSVLADTSTSSKIHKFKYLGLLGFVEQEDRVIHLVGVNSHCIFSHPLLSSPLISSTGNNNEDVV